MTLQDVATSFMESPEFKKMYGQTPTFASLIKQFYANVLHREPDQAGYDFWGGQLEKKLVTPAVVLASFSESNGNKMQTAEATKFGIQYIPYK